MKEQRPKYIYYIVAEVPIHHFLFKKGLQLKVSPLYTTLHHLNAHFVGFVTMWAVKKGVIMVEQRPKYNYYIVAELQIHYFLYNIGLQLKVK